MYNEPETKILIDREIANFVTKLMVQLKAIYKDLI